MTAEYTAPPRKSRASGGHGNFTPTRGPSTASTYPRGPVRPLLPHSPSSLQSLPLLPSRRRLEAAGPGGAAPRSPQPRAPAPPPRPAGRAAEPGLGTSGRGTGHEVGCARVSERRRGTAGSRPRLEPARCAMEIGGPGAPPPLLLLPLLLLLGTGLLPGKFRNAKRALFSRVLAAGTPGLRERRPRAAVPSRGCAQRDSHRDSSTHYSSDVLRC